MAHHDYLYRVILTEDDDGSILIETEDMHEAFLVAEGEHEKRNLAVQYLQTSTGKWVTFSEWYEGQEVR